MILFIYGTGGAGIEVYDLALRNNKLSNKYSSIYFIDDFSDEGDYYGTKSFHFTSCDKCIGNDTAEFIIAVGEPAARKLLYDRIKSVGYSLTTLIDNTAVISDTAKISEGCIINAYAIVSSEVVIKENCFVMFQSIIGHHAFIESNCVICPKATVGGHSRVGMQSFLGLGSSMIQGANIGKQAIVGMGSMVFKSVESGATVTGNPARITKGNSEHKVFTKPKTDNP